MKKLLIILVLLPILGLSQGTITNPWIRNGNTSGNNTDYLGTKDNRSLRFKTNSTLRGQFDSTGNFKMYNNFFIDQSGGVNSLTPKKFFYQEYPPASTLSALYLSQNIPSGTNYFALADTANLVVNGARALHFRQGNQTIMTILGKEVEGNTGTDMANGLVGISSCPATTTAQSTTGGYIPMLKFASLTYSMTNATVSNPYLIQVQAPNIKSNTATTITEWVTMNFPKPTFDPNITCTRMFGISTTTDISVGGNGYFGANSIAPGARIHLAAGNATLPAIQLTTQSSYTAATAGSIYYNTNLGFVHTGGINATANSTLQANLRVGGTTAPSATLDVTGTMSVSSTATLASTLKLGSSAVLTGGNTGTVAVLTDSYIKFTVGWNQQNPADGASYGLTEQGSFNVNNGAANRIYLPCNATFVGYSCDNWNLTTAGSAETATLTMQQNALTTVTLSSIISFTGNTSPTQVHQSDLAQSISYTAGDYFRPYIHCPTWATNPLANNLSITFWFVRRQ